MASISAAVVGLLTETDGEEVEEGMAKEICKRKIGGNKLDCGVKELFWPEKEKNPISWQKLTLMLIFVNHLPLQTT
jgi:hypothetical protein